MKATHFIGIGGIGMSALARILLQRGERVQGSDRSASSLVAELQKEGALVQIGHDASLLSSGMRIVYSTDIGELNPEIQKAKELGLPLLHRADLLDLLLREKKALLVTGTHGKTTTTALLAATLLEAGGDPSFVVGGLIRSLNTNGKAGQGAYFVAEADESDGSFLKTPAFGAIVTNLENDHLNYWKTEENLDAAFGRFFDNAQNSELLFWCCDDPRLAALRPRGISYGFSDASQLQVGAYRATENGCLFDLRFKGARIADIELSLMGRHNALNGAAVFGLALQLGFAESALRKAFRNFSGTARRLEWKGEAGQIAVYDDYGHHPTEIRVTLEALKARIREKRLVAVFQPHRYTRVSDLFEEFTTCFDAADLVVLTDIYSAGEAPIEGVTSEALFALMQKKMGSKVQFISRERLETGVAALLKPFDTVLTLGAGDVTHAGGRMVQALAEKSRR